MDSSTKTLYFAIGFLSGTMFAAGVFCGILFVKAMLS